MIRIKGKTLIFFGFLLLSAALMLLLYNSYESQKAENQSAFIAESLAEKINNEQDSVPDYMAHPEMEMPTIEIEGTRYVGYIKIPDLSVSLPVAAECTSQQLKISPCLYEGSVYLDNAVIAAHNYRSHFGKLINLPMDTEVTFTDAKGNSFSYTLEWVETLEENRKTDLITADDCDLTLFTCTYGGEKRYAFRCIKK